MLFRRKPDTRTAKELMVSKHIARFHAARPQEQEAIREELLAYGMKA